MSISPVHKVKQPLRFIIACSMAALYLAILFSPLASFAMHGMKTKAAIARECSGDCNLCGCSLESRTSNTCCCSKKRAQQAHIHQEDVESVPDCCKTKPAKKETVIACGCPCDKDEQNVLAANAASELLPFYFNEVIHIPHTDTSYFSSVQQLTNRLHEPPVPPPKPA